MAVLNYAVPMEFTLLKKKDQVQINFFAFGTSCEITIEISHDSENEEIANAVISWVLDFEKRYSRFLPDSWLSKINQFAGTKPMPVEEKDLEIIKSALFTYFTSHGALDPSCLPLSLLWQKAKAQGKPPTESEISNARSLVGWQKVKLSEDQIFLPVKGMGLDFGGFGKEFAVDKVSRILKQFHQKNFLVNFGGDIYASGKSPDQGGWKLGIEKDDGSLNPKYILELENKALASSGSYRKYFDFNSNRYGHVLDARTGFPTIHSDLVASVISSSCLKSGVLATTCLLEGKNQAINMLQGIWDTEGCIQSLDSCSVTNNFYKYEIQKFCS